MSFFPSAAFRKFSMAIALFFCVCKYLIMRAFFSVSETFEFTCFSPVSIIDFARPFSFKLSAMLACFVQVLLKSLLYNRVCAFSERLNKQ